MGDAQHQASAKLDRFIGLGPRTSAPLRRLRDVVVCVNDPSVESSVDEYQAHPPIASPAAQRLRGSSDPVDLGRSVSIDRLSDDDSELVMNACTPRGHYFVPTRQFGQRYSIVREADPEEWESRPYRWDPEGTVWDALSLSRLVRDNAYSTEYAARIADFEDGEQTVVYTLGAESKHVYRLRRDREWLDRAEGFQLREVLAAYWQGDGPALPRVRRALWRVEYASWLKWGDLVLPTLVSGLEALLKTDRHQATRQFVTRVPLLAQELGIDAVDHDLCASAYDARSDWVHGSHVRLFTSGLEGQETEGGQGPRTADQWQRFADIARMQDVLRAAVRRCIEDDAFRDRFADDEIIRASFPL